MAYVALMPCRFAGTAYKIGERVPEGVLVPGAEKRLLGMGILAPAGQDEPQKESQAPVGQDEPQKESQAPAPAPARKTGKKTEA